MKKEEQQLATGVKLDIIAKSILILTGYGINIFLARTYGPDKYRDIGLVISILWFFEIFLTNGLRQTISKYVSEGKTDIYYLLKKSRNFQMIMALLLIIIGAILAYPLTIIFDSRYLLKYFFLILIIIPIEGLYYLNFGYLNGKKNFKKQSLSNILYSIARFCFVIIITLFTNNGFFPIILGTFFAYFIVYFYTKKTITYDNKNENNSISYKELISFTWKITVFYGLSVIYLNIDYYLINTLEKDRFLLGNYRSIMNFGQAVYFLYSTIIITFFPIIASMNSANKKKELTDLINKINTIIILLATSIILGAFCFGEYIIIIMFGNDYTISNQYLVPHVVAVIILNFTINISNIGILIKTDKKVYITLIISIFITVISTFILYPYFGIISAPLSIAFALIIYNFIIYRDIKKNISIKLITKNNLLLIIIFSMYVILTKILFMYINGVCFDLSIKIIIYISFLAIIFKIYRNELLTIIKSLKPKKNK
ncbi:MAG: oligosaccharide flippase family protein [Clostridiales bacterium]